MSNTPELNVAQANPADMANAVDLASDQDRMTWLVENGKRIAAIVPVDDAEAAERRYNPAAATRPLSGYSLVLSALTLDAIQAEATRAHLRHGDKSMLSDSYTNHERYAVLAEEAGEAVDAAVDMLGRAAELSGKVLHIGHLLTYDQDQDPEKLEIELIQVAAMAGTWIEALAKRHAARGAGPHTHTSGPATGRHRALAVRSPALSNGVTG